MPSILLSAWKTLADINIDSMNVWGKARDVEDTSFGFSDLDDMLAAAAKRRAAPRFKTRVPKREVFIARTTSNSAKLVCRRFTSATKFIFFRDQ